MFEVIYLSGSVVAVLMVIYATISSYREGWVINPAKTFFLSLFMATVAAALSWLAVGYFMASDVQRNQ